MMREEGEKRERIEEREREKAVNEGSQMLPNV